MDNPTAQRVAAEIRAEMARQGVTAGTVAQATDMSRSTLHRKLTDRTAFTVTEAARVCTALGVPLSEMVRRAEATMTSAVA